MRAPIPHRYRGGIIADGLRRHCVVGLSFSRVLDPATPHTSAIAASHTLANARLLTIDGWGHGYFVGGTSSCADEATVAYFLDGQLPSEGTVCQEDAPPPFSN